MVWTASEKTYANAILNFLDPDNKIFRYRLFADSCYQHPEGPIKDLQAINRRPSDIIIIDNSPYSYGIQQANAIPILPFYGSDTDNQLKSLEEYLLRLEPVFDIR
jgi:CTD small phosphatase-like protein 2